MMSGKIRILAVAGLLAGAAMITVSAYAQQGGMMSDNNQSSQQNQQSAPGNMPYGQGGQGMMGQGGPGMTGPGMMGQGGMMGPGMMGRGGMMGPGMMGRGGMMGSGMMGQWSAADRDYTSEDAHRMVDGMLARMGFAKLKVGKVESGKDGEYKVVITTKSGDEAFSLKFDIKTGYTALAE